MRLTVLLERSAGVLQAISSWSLKQTSYWS